jgi:outer membrane protein OmpA-like peptidoglycan-associated protein
VNLVQPPPPPEVELEDEDVAPPPPPPPPPPVWKPQELARVEEQQILIRDPIQFELGTNRILPVSEPTMRAIARLLSEKPEIGHLVIEGHASEEGDFAYNYKLSMERAIAVNQALVAAGVHPWRLSCRAMGEVQPVVAGDAPEALAANRRVLFHVVRQLRAEESMPPEMTAPVRVPWTGEPAQVLPLPERAAPPPPPPEPAPAVPEQDFREEDDR